VALRGLRRRNGPEEIRSQLGLTRRPPHPEWFLDAKFGVFIHWGVYSVPAWGKHGEYAEWYWRRITSNNPKETAWRDFHAKNYGTNFDYMDFARSSPPSSTTRSNGPTSSPVPA